MEEADREAPADGGVRRGPRVAERDDPGRHRDAVEHVVAAAVLDLGHHVDLGDRFGVDPVRDERAGPDDLVPPLLVVQRPQRVVARCREDHHAPRPVVGRQRGRRERAVGLEHRTAHRREGPVAGAEVTRVVEEAGLVDLFLRPWRPGFAQPRGHRRTTAAGVDHQVGSELLALLGDHAAHVDPAVTVRCGDQAPHPRAAPDLHPCVGRGACHDGLHQRTAAGDRPEAIVARPWSSGDGRGQHLERAPLQGSGVGEGRRHVGHLGPHRRGEPGQEAVRTPELADAPALPSLPRSLRIRAPARVAFEDRHVMAVTLEEQRPAQADHATPDHHDAGHGGAPPFAGPSFLLGRPSTPRRHQRRRADVEQAVLEAFGVGVELGLVEPRGGEGRVDLAEVGQLELERGGHGEGQVGVGSDVDETERPQPRGQRPAEVEIDAPLGQQLDEAVPEAVGPAALGGRRVESGARVAGRRRSPRRPPTRRGARWRPWSAGRGPVRAGASARAGRGPGRRRRGAVRAPRRGARTS